MSRVYDEYLEQHRNNVAKGFDWIRENTPEILGAYLNDELENQICYKHDASKNELDEYEAYDAYFYGGNRSYYVVRDFNLAWLLHIHRNPHHWQYWILHNDDPDEGMVVMDMPYKYIVEMICDWWAFSWQKENLYGIFDWYDEHKDYIKLSFKTRYSVETILRTIKQKLDEKGGSDNE